MNKLIHGDCLEVMKTFPSECIDLTVTSPPYDNLRDYNGYSFDFEGIAKELYRVTKKGGVVCWVVGDATINGSETGTSFRQALFFKEIGFNLHDTMIYQKSFYAPKTHRRYEQVFEYMFVFSKGTPKTFNGIVKENVMKASMASGNHTQSNGTKKKMSASRKTHSLIGNIIKYNPETKSSHVAPFPEKLAEDHILSWSNEGDTVLDPMAGSGTTLKMAKKHNRNYIGIEISKEYIDIINKRLNLTTNDNE